MPSATTKKLAKKVQANTKKARAKAKKRDESDPYEMHELLRHSKAHDALEAVKDNEGNAEVMDLLNFDMSDPPLPSEIG